MLSVEEIKEELNAPFEKGGDRPARCYSRRDAEVVRRQAYRFLRPLAGEEEETDDRPEAKPAT